MKFIILSFVGLMGSGLAMADTSPAGLVSDQFNCSVTVTNHGDGSVHRMTTLATVTRLPVTSGVVGLTFTDGVIPFSIDVPGHDAPYHTIACYRHMTIWNGDNAVRALQGRQPVMLLSNNGSLEERVRGCRQLLNERYSDPNDLQENIEVSLDGVVPRYEGDSMLIEMAFSDARAESRMICEYQGTVF